jgi:amidase
VHVDGALVAFGDAHGVQGDGEITGVAVEIEAEVELTMRVRDREEAGFVERLHRAHGFSRADAYQLLGQVGRVRVGNMIDPFFSVLASVEWRYLEPA